jgi:transcriptional regulator with XRE-family HTH domain
MFDINYINTPPSHLPIALTPIDLGAWFRRERRLFKLTQTQVAEQVGCRRQTIAELERGENVGLYTLFKALAVVNRGLAIRPLAIESHELHLLLDPEDRHDD